MNEYENTFDQIHDNLDKNGSIDVDHSFTHLIGGGGKINRQNNRQKSLHFNESINQANDDGGGDHDDHDTMASGKKKTKDAMLKNLQ